MCNAFHKSRLDRRLPSHALISKVTQGRSDRQWASSALRQEIPGNDLRMQRCVTPKPMLKHRCPEMVLRPILILIDSETADASQAKPDSPRYLRSKTSRFCSSLWIWQRDRFTIATREEYIAKQKSTWFVFPFSKSYAILAIARFRSNNWIRELYSISRLKAFILLMCLAIITEIAKIDLQQEIWRALPQNPILQFDQDSDTKFGDD